MRKMWLLLRTEYSYFRLKLEIYRDGENIDKKKFMINHLFKLYELNTHLKQFSLNPPEQMFAC